MTGGELLILLVPTALAVLLLALFSLEHLLLLTLFFTPLSLQLSWFTGGSGFDISVPTEPILALLLFITLFKLIVTREFPLKLLRHPVTIMVGLYLLWTIVTSITSTMPGVSFKTLAYRMWFTAGFYLVAAQLAGSGRFSRKYIIAYFIRSCHSGDILHHKGSGCRSSQPAVRPLGMLSLF